MDAPNQQRTEGPESTPHRRQFTSSLFREIALSDPEGWRRLAVVVADYVRGKCRDAGISSQDSDDLTQEVCADVLRHVRAFRHERTGTNLLRWVRAITRSKIADHFRSQMRCVTVEPHGESEPPFVETPEPLRDAIELLPNNDAQRRILDRAMAIVRAKVLPQTWEAFRSVTIERSDAVEVAAKLHMTSHAVREAVYRVRALLKMYTTSLAELRDDSAQGSKVPPP